MESPRWRSSQRKYECMGWWSATTRVIASSSIYIRRLRKEAAQKITLSSRSIFAATSWCTAAELQQQTDCTTAARVAGCIVCGQKSRAQRCSYASPAIVSRTAYSAGIVEIQSSTWNSYNPVLCPLPPSVGKSITQAMENCVIFRCTRDPARVSNAHCKGSCNHHGKAYAAVKKCSGNSTSVAWQTWSCSLVAFAPCSCCH